MAKNSQIFREVVHNICPQATQAAGVTGPRECREKNAKKYQKMGDFP